MATRTIVTSQPDVACYVCERRLLRGEQPEVFLAAGRPRTVCELCAPRAAHEGWLRESDERSVSVPALRARRGRNLFDRWRQRSRTAQAPPDAPAGNASYDPEPEYDFLGGGSPVAANPVRASQQGRSALALAEDRAPSPPPHSEPSRPFGLSGPAVGLPALAGGSLTERAIAVFNVGEYPRRVASLARSLGAPSVNVRLLEDFEDVVVIVVAWELCWYRYQVDLSDQVPDVQATGQGTELDELRREDRLANAGADEFGALSPATA
jgi:hypothetical protein